MRTILIARWKVRTLAALGVMAATATIGSTAGTAAPGSENSEDGRNVTVCHLPPGNPGRARAISVGYGAVSSHLAHGDSLCACRDGMEVVSRYRDDLENGRFDAFLPRGSGAYSVVDDGRGNLAASLVGDVTLVMHPATWSARTWRDYYLRLKMKRSGSGSVAVGFRWLRPALPMHDLDRGYWLQNTDRSWALQRESNGAITALDTIDSTGQHDEWQEVTVSVCTTEGGARIQAFLGSRLLVDYLDENPIPFGGLLFRTEGDATGLLVDDVEVVEQIDTRQTWSQARGPQGVSGADAVAVDPRDSNVAYLGGLDAGLFKTTDGGGSWREIGLTNGMWTPRVRTIVPAPSNPDIVYVGAGAKHISPVWRSDDRGATWHWMSIDHDRDSYGGADTIGLAVDPADPMHIYFGIASVIAAVPPDKVGVYESFDGARTFTNLHSGGGQIGPVVIDPADRLHILAGSLSASSAGVSIVGSPDGGATWVPSDAGITGDDIAEILFYPPDPGHVFAVAATLAPEVGGTVYRSKDGGHHWRVLDSLGRANAVRFTSDPDPTLYALRPDGLYTSTDKGDTWRRNTDTDPTCLSSSLAFGTDDPSMIYSITPPSVSISDDLGITCTRSVNGLLAHPVSGLGIAPSNSQVVYIGTMTGLYRSTDGGSSWAFLRRGGYAGIAVDPTDSETVYIGSQELVEVQKSTDGGTTWRDITGSIDFPGVQVLAIDPQDRMTIYAGTGHGPQLGPGGAGMYRSRNGGGSWQKIPGIPDVAVPTIVVDPADSNHIVVGTVGHGVFVSDDGGISFEQRNDGFLTHPAGPKVWTIALDPRDANIMYAGTNKFYSGDVGAPNALYKTTDGGFHWSLLLAQEEVANRTNRFINFGCCVDAIAINSERPDEVFVALHDPGIVFSENGGKDWRYINQGVVPLLTHIYAYRMGISPDGQLLYATSCGRSIFRNFLNAPETFGAMGQSMVQQ